MLADLDHSILIWTIVVGLAYVIYLRSLNYKKDPIWTILFAFVSGGISSVVISMIIYEFIGFNNFYFSAVFLAGPVEESAKFLTLILIYPVLKSNFDELTDGILYAGLVALGFATIENYFYAFNSFEKYQVLLLRSFFSIIGHISFSIVFGIAFYIHTKVKYNYSGLLIALIVAFISHGIYNLLALNGLVRFALAYLIFFDLMLLRAVRSISLKRGDFRMEKFTLSNDTDIVTCQSCSNKSRLPIYRFKKIESMVCDNCNSILFKHGQFPRLLNYFCPSIVQKHFFRNLPVNGGLINMDEEGKVLYHPGLSYLAAEENALRNWLIEQNESHKWHLFNKPYGRIFQAIGLKHMYSLKDAAPPYDVEIRETRK